MEVIVMGGWVGERHIEGLSYQCQFCDKIFWSKERSRKHSYSHKSTATISDSTLSNIINKTLILFQDERQNKV